jgi:hypothetical protein
MQAKQTPVEAVDGKLRRKGTTLAAVCGLDRSAACRWSTKRDGAIPDRYFSTILKRSLELRAGVTMRDLVVGA